MRFFLGTHQPHWLRLTTAPLFISDRRLREYKTLPTARGTWALDSGGFTELQQYGRWETSPREYADRVRRYRDEIGGLLWAAPQDWMCESVVIQGGAGFVGTGLSVTEHQKRTVENGLHLRAIAPDLPFIYVLQGNLTEDYLACAQMYREAGADLASEATVGIGSVCRRQGTLEAAEIITAVREAVPGIRLHGFGIKTSGLGAYGRQLTSSDSMAWSYDARRKRFALPGCETKHKNCANCPRFAFRWRERVLTSLARHSTRIHLSTSPGKGTQMSRKLDSRAQGRARLTLSAFRDEAARLERDTTIRREHRAGMSVRQIADLVALSPARVGQVIAEPEPDGGLLKCLRELRQRWGVDEDPATSAAADQIIAHLAADDLIDHGADSDVSAIVSAGVQDEESDSETLSLFDVA
ncbi:DUF7221 family queuine tRNA-ribosyltransferase-like protein [Streptomyces oceani]|uniref:deazapurine DNA modification protein DpdA family protein n=1 Tax=Streptomyces oceani TaxID=1075402 RepID=UPI000873454B|nr:hypothetical protein [Streptomyces oceani]